jgi:hypothetical protein
MLVDVADRPPAEAAPTPGVGPVASEVLVQGVSEGGHPAQRQRTLGAAIRHQGPGEPEPGRFGQASRRVGHLADLAAEADLPQDHHVVTNRLARLGRGQAMQTARSAPGSLIRTPPTTETYTSW